MRQQLLWLSPSKGLSSNGGRLCVGSERPITQLSFPAQQDESSAGKRNQHAAKEIEQVVTGAAGGGENVAMALLC